MSSIDAVEAARQRRVAKSAEKTARVEWFIEQVSSKIKLTMRQRVTLATAFLQSKVILNISIPVKKVKSSVTGRVIVVERSKPGEFPRADTTQLMKTIFNIVREEEPGNFQGYVGTPLDYGLILETSARLNRSFLRRTFNEEHSKVMSILNGPIT